MKNIRLVGQRDVVVGSYILFQTFQRYMDTRTYLTILRVFNNLFGNRFAENAVWRQRGSTQ